MAKCREIADENEAVFIKRPVYEKNLLSTLIGKNYIKSDILHDTTDKYYWGSTSNKMKTIKKLPDFPTELALGSQPTKRPGREDLDVVKKGFCIRTGVSIPFNPKRPFCENAYRSWAQFCNLDYPECYCHKTGEKSYGKTSMKNPILK